MSIKDWKGFNEYFNPFNDLYDYSSKGKEYDKDEFLSDFESLISDFESEDEDGLGWTQVDLLSEVGDLCNTWSVTSSHLKELIDSGLDKYSVLHQLYDETLQTEAEQEVENSEELVGAYSFEDVVGFSKWILQVSSLDNENRFVYIESKDDFISDSGKRYTWKDLYKKYKG